MKTRISEAFAETAAGAVCAALAESREAPVLALACGKTMQPVWARLAEEYKAGRLSLREARILCVTEFCGVAPEKSCRRALETGLLQAIDCRPENVFFPDAEHPEASDERINTLGGIDLAVLGLGENGHIGYNEPGTLFEARTHVQKLTDRTKRQLFKRGFSEADMPERAVTLGIKTLTEARRILLLASGEEKAAAVYQTLYAKTMSYIPASFLQIPPEVTVILDPAAAAQL